jgi:hypothetical protein
MIKDYRHKPDWFERHAGLGGWIGAIGAVIAILAAWWLARAEYQRTQRLEDARVNTEISLISRTATEFDPIVQQFIKFAEAHDQKVHGYSKRQQDDGRWLRMVDFNTMPITQWPSVDSYDAFKRYFLASRRLIEAPNTLSNTEFQLDPELLQNYRGTFERLKKALEAARR